MLAEFLTDVMLPQHVALPDDLPEIELPDDWKVFEETLGRYKQEYKNAMNTYRAKEAELVQVNNDVTLLMNASTVLTCQATREHILALVDEFKIEHDVDRIHAELVELKAKIKAMEGVLMNTNAKKYSQFTCSICMESMVDTFIDPCGHVACERCLGRTRTQTCPMCRSNVRELKRIYATFS